MNNFRYHAYTDIRFGKGQVECLAEVIAPYGKNVLMVYGGGSIRKNGLYDKVKSLLADFNVFELGGVEPNPKITSIRDGVVICKKEKIDVVLAVGGGSTIDAAKVIGKKSYGKGTVQTINNVYGGGAIKYTTAYYLTPLGNNINEIGITPHAEVENSLKEVDMSQFGEFDYNNVFSLGNKAEQIKTAKEMLSYLGVYIGEINDVYDENMRIAVSTFQKIEGLFPYGVLDKTTQFNLYKTMSELKEELDDQLKAALSAF